MRTAYPAISTKAEIRVASMAKISDIALFAMFWMLCGALLLGSGKPPLAVLAGLVCMTLPYLISLQVQTRHRARVAAARKAAGSVDGVMRPLLRDAAIAVIAGMGCLGLALWALLSF